MKIVPQTRCSWIDKGRFSGAGPWPDGQYYVYDKKKASICNPDTGDGRIPYRYLSTPYEATISAKLLNEQFRLYWKEITGDENYFDHNWRYLRLANIDPEYSLTND